VSKLPDQTTALEQAIGLAQRGALEEAEVQLRALLEQDPALARAYNVLGVVQLQQGKLEEAEASLLRAAQAAPEDPRAHINLGKLYSTQRRPDDAERHLREAVRLAPANADAHFNLALLLKEVGQLEEAEAGLRRAIELQPQDAQAHYVLARLLLETSRFAQAEFCFREAIRLQPDFAVACSDLAMVLLETGRLRAAEESCREAIRIAPGFLRAWSNYVMCGQYDPEASNDELLARTRQAGQAVQAAAARFSAPLAPAAISGARLKLGIVSGDLHHHPVGLFLLPLLRELKQQGIKVTLYSNGSVVDEVSEQLGDLAEWIDIAAQSDDEAWAHIRRDRPDVLIDLAGHTGNNRLALFAGRAAALQVSWLGYFATTGTPNMDCVLMDPWHAPAGCEDQFSERILRMPHTRFCFQPIDAAPAAVARPPSAERGHVTFGSFNSIAKINEKVIQAWSRILNGTAGSRMVLKWRTLADASLRGELAARFQRAGIGPERLEFRPASDHAALLAEYGGIDIALDTFPFTGGQTSFEAVWMGVPVVSLAGLRPVSRQTLCVLGNIGLEDLAAFSVDDFVDRAVALAKDGARLGKLRSTLRWRMQDSPLMQAPEFAQSFTDILLNAARTV
jgi:predicted O-linked N-acetylglucosamine transferase (SPINDLY family)